MSRRHAAEKREVLPDAKFGDIVLTKFMNNLMIDGKKSVAERIVYNAFDRVESKLKKAPVETSAILHFQSRATHIYKAAHRTIIIFLRAAIQRISFLAKTHCGPPSRLYAAQHTKPVGHCRHTIFEKRGHRGQDRQAYERNTQHYFGRFAPYLERRCLRFLTPCVSSTPRMVW